MNTKLLPRVERERMDFRIENGQENPKQKSIRNSKMPIYFFAAARPRRNAFWLTARSFAFGPVSISVIA